MINYIYELYFNLIEYIEENNKVIKREYMWAK